MFMSLAVLSTPLAGQSSVLFGYAGTLGGGVWQIEALEVGVATTIGLGPVRSVAATLRGGWFADQAVLLSGTRGLVGAMTLALRSGRLTVAEVGDAITPTLIALDVSLEGAGYLAARSPLPEGQRWVSLAVLPAVRVGQVDGMQFTFALGPAFFAGRTQHTHAFLAVRGEIPLARRSGGP
jgi:hypothetical protein